MLFVAPRAASSRTSTVIAVILAALVSIAAAPDARAGISVQPDQTQQLTGAVRSSISQAAVDFSAWRNGVSKADEYGAAYKPTASMRRLCPTCVVDDEFATADTDERFVVTLDFDVSKSWSRAQTLAYVQRNIGGLVSTYKMQQGTDDNGDNWFDWTTGSPVRFVYVKTFAYKTRAGFEVRIGHYLPKNLRYVPYAILSPAQRSDLTNAVKSYVQLGVQDAVANYTTLRGKASDKDNNYFTTNVTFGEYMTSCDVDGIFSNLTAAGTTSKWILECETPTLGGAKSDVEDVIRAAVAGALPSDFTLSTDPASTSMTDFRWDRYSDSVSVEITSSDNDDGTFTYHIEIYHFLS